MAAHGLRPTMAQQLLELQLAKAGDIGSRQAKLAERRQKEEEARALEDAARRATLVRLMPCYCLRCWCCNAGDAGGGAGGVVLVVLYCRLKAATASVFCLAVPPRWALLEAPPALRLHGLPATWLQIREHLTGVLAGAPVVEVPRRLAAATRTDLDTLAAMLRELGEAKQLSVEQVRRGGSCGWGHECVGGVHERGKVQLGLAGQALDGMLPDLQDAAPPCNTLPLTLHALCVLLCRPCHPGGGPGAAAGAGAAAVPRGATGRRQVTPPLPLPVHLPVYCCFCRRCHTPLLPCHINSLRCKLTPLAPSPTPLQPSAPRGWCAATACRLRRAAPPPSMSTWTMPTSLRHASSSEHCERSFQLR